MAAINYFFESIQEAWKNNAMPFVDKITQSIFFPVIITIVIATVAYFAIKYLTKNHW